MNKLFNKFLCIAFSNGPIRGNCFLYKVCCIISSKLKSDHSRVISQKNMIPNRRPIFFWVLMQTEFIHVIFPLLNHSFLHHVNNFLGWPNVPGLARPWSNFMTSSASSRKYFALLGFIPTLQGKTFAVAGNWLGTLAVMVSNITSSEKSSPMHSTKSGSFPCLVMVEIMFSTAVPLLMPWSSLKRPSITNQTTKMEWSMGWWLIE